MRRLHHRPLELVVGHRAEQELVGGDRARELGMGAEAPVDVGPEPDHHRTAGDSSASMNVSPPVGVVAQGEELLELIDDDELARVVAGVGVGMGAGREQPRAVDARDFAGAHRRDDAGAQDR